MVHTLHSGRCLHCNGDALRCEQKGNSQGHVTEEVLQLSMSTCYTQGGVSPKTTIFQGWSPPPRYPASAAAAAATAAATVTLGTCALGIIACMSRPGMYLTRQYRVS